MRRRSNSAYFVEPLLSDRLMREEASEREMRPSKFFQCLKRSKFIMFSIEYITMMPRDQSLGEHLAYKNTIFSGPI